MLNTFIIITFIIFIYFLFASKQLVQFQEVLYFATMWWKYSRKKLHFLPINGYKYTESDHVLVVVMHVHYEEIFVDSAT